MRWAGYTHRIHATEIGDYTVWSVVVPGSKPIVLFPGFGLGAVPYHRVLQKFGRTIHIVELPNLGFATPPTAPGYLTSETLYRVVRAHVGNEPHDIVAHSLGSSPAAFYVNHQHTLQTTPENQTAVICDGFVCPVDAPLSHLYPFVDRHMYRDVTRTHVAPVPWRTFSGFLWAVVHDLDVTIFTKRVHNLYDGTLWREDYRTKIRYVFSERDLLYDVPFLRETVSRSDVDVDQNHFLFVPKTRHGGCLFGHRRNEVLTQMELWFGAGCQDHDDSKAR